MAQMALLHITVKMLPQLVLVVAVVAVQLTQTAMILKMARLVEMDSSLLD